MTKKILIISKVNTHPLEMGNSKAILSQAEILKKLGCEIDFLYVQEIGLGKGHYEKSKRNFLKTKEYWGEHFIYLRVGKTEKILKNVLSLFRQKVCGGHEGTYDKYPWKLTSYLKKIQRERKYDICLVQYYYLTKLFKTIKFEKMACFTHDVFSYKNLIVNEQCPWIDANQEARAMQLCTDVLAIQEEEKNYYHNLAPQSRVYNVYSPYSYVETPFVGNHRILFLSGNNVYNQNGLRWFVYEVFPLVKRKYSDAKLVIAGGICKEIKKQYEHIDGIELLGYVEEPVDLYKLGDVAINPTYQGTGLKIKTFEAISYGKATMVHPHSMAGVYNKETAPLFSSDKPQEWSDHIETIWGQPEVIREIKKQDELYIQLMNEYIVQEYKRFLSV